MYIIIGAFFIKLYHIITNLHIQDISGSSLSDLEQSSYCYGKQKANVDNFILLPFERKERCHIL